MYIASWNKKYPENKLYKNTNSTGYYVGTSVNPTTTYITMSNTPGYQDELYYPHTQSNCAGYWLVSPSAYDYESEMFVFDNGDVSYTGYFTINWRITSASSFKV